MWKVKENEPRVCVQVIVPQAESGAAEYLCQVIRTQLLKIVAVKFNSHCWMPMHETL
jgi:hypothetical protein